MDKVRHPAEVRDIGETIVGELQLLKVHILLQKAEVGGCCFGHTKREVSLPETVSRLFQTRETFPYLRSAPVLPF